MTRQGPFLTMPLFPTPWTNTGHTGRIENAFTRGSLGFTVATDNTIRVWDGRGACIAEMRGHSAEIRLLRFLPGEHRGLFVTGSLDRTLRVWNAEGTLYRATDAHATFGMSHLVIRDSLIYWSDDENCVRIWDPTLDEVTVLEGHSSLSFLTVFAVLGDRRVLSASSDRDLRLWSPTGDCLKVMTGHKNGVDNFAILPNGDYLSWTGSKDGEIFLWSTHGDLKRRIRGFFQYVTTVKIYADGTFLAIGQGGQRNEVLFLPSGDPVESGSSSSVSENPPIPGVYRFFEYQNWPKDDPSCPFRIRSAYDVRNNNKATNATLLGTNGLAYLHLGLVSARNHITGTSYDLLSDFSLLVVRERRVVLGLHVEPTGGTKIVYENSGSSPRKTKISPSRDLSSLAKWVHKVIASGESVLGVSSMLYVSVHSRWAVEVLKALPQESADRIRAIRIGSIEALDAVAVQLPSYNLRMLQLWRLPGETTVDQLYGLAVEELHVFACDDLIAIHGASCGVQRVSIEACPHVKRVEIVNIAGDQPEVRFMGVANPTLR